MASPPQPDTPSLASVYLSTAHAAIDAYSSLRVPTILAHRSPTCTHHLLPSSLNQPVRNNAESAAYLATLLSAFDEFRVTVKDSMVDERQRKVVIWAESCGRTLIGDYRNEYMIVFCMSEDGKLVDKMLEFVDSVYSKEYMAKLRDALSERKSG